MYVDWFQLSGRPFAITPDPRYLYLSERHREALAHLLYGVSEGGGFIQLTGEVGTGKTTLTRTLLEQLPEHVDAALLYNPLASLTEFLESICDELGVGHDAGAVSPKRLTDALNDYLLAAHARGRRTVLIVDEAQNLSAELLEQVRMLTNLETHQDKLLHILLIGQPELRDTLAKSSLRQLAQRVTARYHLEPLDADETAAYVRHRLEVAGARRPLFTAAALRSVHRFSGGIPRLINVVCDRALLGAFADGAQAVDAALLRRAAREIRGDLKPAAIGPALATGVVAAAVLAAALAWQGYRPGVPQLDASVATGHAAPQPPAAVIEPEPEPVDPAAMFGDDDDLADAAARLLALWGVNDVAGLPAGLCNTAADARLDCVRGRGTWNNLRVLDRPALLELRMDGVTRTVLLTGLDGTEARVWASGRTHALPVLALDAVWMGEYLMLWQPPVPVGQTLRAGSRGDGVIWLRDALARWSGEREPATDPAWFDEALESRVRAFQRALGLEVDGLAGEQTLVHLDGVAESGGPRLGDGSDDVTDP